MLIYTQYFYFLNYHFRGPRMIFKMIVIANLNFRPKIHSRRIECDLEAFYVLHKYHKKGE